MMEDRYPPLLSSSKTEMLVAEAPSAPGGGAPSLPAALSAEAAMSTSSWDRVPAGSEGSRCSSWRTCKHHTITIDS